MLVGGMCERSVVASRVLLAVSLLLALIQVARGERLPIKTYTTETGSRITRSIDRARLGAASCGFALERVSRI